MFIGLRQNADDHGELFPYLFVAILEQLGIDGGDDLRVRLDPLESVDGQTPPNGILILEDSSNWIPAWNMVSSQGLEESFPHGGQPGPWTPN